MKKKYQSPEAQLVLVNTLQMIAASPVENGFDPSKPIGTTGATSGNLSRRGYSVWDDENEEDY